MPAREAPNAPSRAPHDAEEEAGASRGVAAANVVARLCSGAARSPRWRCPLGEIIATLEAEGDGSGVIRFIGAASGKIALSVDPSGWVRAELEMDGLGRVCAWVERGYEEFELWPNGSDGVLRDPARDEPPGRIGKRITWIELERARWTDAPTGPRFFVLEAEM